MGLQRRLIIDILRDRAESFALSEAADLAPRQSLLINLLLPVYVLGVRPQGRIAAFARCAVHRSNVIYHQLLAWKFISIS